MKKCIVINSATHLQRAKKILFSENIKCFSEKLRQPSAFGCAWCLAVEEAAVSKAVKLLQKRGIPIYGVRNHD